MSKFLKFIVHFVMLCTIICVVALTVPPFYGVETVIIDDNSEVTNLELGSVTYAIPVNIAEVNLGTPLLVKDTEEGVTKTYKYNLATVDLANGTGTVIDSSAAERETINVSIKNMVPKVVITIPYLGYLWVATQSIEGLIVLGLAILFLVILYVIAELWKKEPEDEEEEYEEEVPVKSAKELKREEKERAKRMKEEDKELLREAKSNKKKTKKEKPSRKIIKTGGFVDEIYEDELQEDDEAETSADIQNAASEAHELLRKEIAAATAEEPLALETEEVLEKTRNLETAAKAVKAKKAKKEEVAEPEEKEIIKITIPQRSAVQLAAAAKKAGDAPDIVRDPITKVTLFDYSDIISEAK